MKNETLIIGSRGSDLALWQANWTRSALAEHHPELDIEITIVQTKGDQITDVDLSKVGGKGLFTKALEDKLLDGSIDIAVHSLKDLPTELPTGLEISAVTIREDPRDAFVSTGHIRFKDLPEKARVATGSLRRKSQLLNRRPDLQIQPLRGNVPTRLEKLRNSDWHGIVLAKAGLKRLELLDDSTEILDWDVMLPAVGQGALGIETREEDFQVNAILAPINDADTEAGTRAERALLRKLEGGCQVPIGAHGYVDNGRLYLQAYVGTLDGSHAVRGAIDGSPDDAGKLGIRLAEQLLGRGADGILESVREAERQND